MRRLAILLVVLVAGLGGTIFWRLRAQAQGLHGPSGGSGEIEGTDVDLAARITARVAALHHKKGEAVKKGELLLSLECDDPRATLAEAEARLEASRAQATAALASIDASKRSKEAAAAAQQVARAQAAALVAQRDAAGRQASRLDAVATDVTVASRDQVRASAEGLKHQVEAAEAQASASAVQSRAAEVAIRASGAQATAAEAQTRAAQATVDRARLLVGECEVRAPRDALIGELPHEVGEVVLAGQPLVRLVDLVDLKATFYLPNAELSQVKLGQRAEVAADAWPGERFAGTVATVALTAEFTPRNIQTRTDRDRLVYPVEVRLDNPGGRLRPGMPVQVFLPGTER